MNSEVNAHISNRRITALLVGASLCAITSTQAQAQVQTKPEVQAPRSESANQPDSGNDIEILVTGVLDRTLARKANVSFSTLSEEDMAKFTPISADDMLRDMPGVVVESNDGVARNEVFTRGMTIGTGANTSGYFWTTILEDGLPVVPFKFSGFQDGYFYRADISTARVESVRGGSSVTGVTTSAGATFNYITGDVKPGAALQARIGFEGEDSHLSWKQIDGRIGFVNSDDTAGIGVSGFYRTSNGQVDPGYNLNQGGQFKVNAYKKYTTSNGSGSFNLVFKHLDDTNAELIAFDQPTYGYENPQDIPGFGRDVNLWMYGGEQTVPNYFKPGSHTLDPKAGFRYKQDAAWLRWNHDFDSGVTLAGTVRAQHSTYRGQSYRFQGVQSLSSAAATRDRYGLNINNLDRTPGFYEFFDNSGTVLARVANNVAGSQLGIDYRTGLACPRVTSTTTAGRCVVSNLLPNANIDLRGGSVTATIANPDGTFSSGIVPVASASRDLVMQTRSEDNFRSSTDFMMNFTAGYRSDKLSIHGGIYVSHADQDNENYANGLGMSAWADGQVRNLNVRYVTSTGTTYQLTDAGGWGNYGSGLFTTVDQSAKITEVSPYGGVRWSPNRHWDFDASFKYQHYWASTYSDTWDTRNSAASSLANGGLDNNPLTVYDNVYMVSTPSKLIRAKRDIGWWNWTAALGYNLNENHKVYFRYTNSKNPAMGLIARYRDQASLVRPLGPTAFIKGWEAAYSFRLGGLNGQITYFNQKFAVNDYPVATDRDNVSTYLLPENFNQYVSRGVEAWAKWKITKNLEWSPSVTYLTGRNIASYTWLNTGANGLGPDDDILRVNTGILARTPKWTISNTLSYRLGDFRFNLRHRWMDVRKVTDNELDTRYLPTQDNLDLSVQFAGIKDTKVTFDVRNVLNTSYVSAYNPMINSNLPANVQVYDVVAQLPESGYFLRRNAPRSYWLTVRTDF